jgi:hypothetical protein
VFQHRVTVYQKSVPWQVLTEDVVKVMSLLRYDGASGTHRCGRLSLYAYESERETVTWQQDLVELLIELTVTYFMHTYK